MNRLWRHLLCVVLLLSAQARVAGHAGHDDIPEASTELLGTISPRFYAVSDIFEGVLVFADPQRLDRPTLFLARADTNLAIIEAEVAAEIITPKQQKLTVTDGTSKGSYYIEGVDPKSTSSISIEAVRGSDADILTFDNVIVPDSAESHNGELHEDHGVLEIAGMPHYLLVALLLVALVLAIANIFVLLIWLRRERNARRSTPPAAVLLFAAITCSFEGQAFAHAGDEHTGLSLTGAGVQSAAGARHFVSVDTQFEADIRTTRVIETRVPYSFRALGRIVVRPDREANVTPPAEGKLLPPDGADGTIPITGTTVTKGQTLLVLEQTIPAAEKVTLTTERSQIEADLASARQELSVATREKQRAEQLTAVISATELDRAQADQKIAQDRVTGLEQRLATLVAALQGTGPSVRQIPVTAPISGFIAESHATNGEYVTTDKELFTIVNLDEVFVVADIFESDIARVMNANTARVTVEAYPHLSFVGTLQSFGQQVDPETRTLRGQFNIANSQYLLRGGMFANVEIESDAERPTLAIPKQAVFTENGIRQVFKKLSPEIYVAMPVAVSAYRDNYAIIAEGLKKGDRVAVNGLYQIRMSPVVGEGK